MRPIIDLLAAMRDDVLQSVMMWIAEELERRGFRCNVGVTPPARTP